MHFCIHIKTHFKKYTQNSAMEYIDKLFEAHMADIPERSALPITADDRNRWMSVILEWRNIRTKMGQSRYVQHVEHTYQCTPYANEDQALLVEYSYAVREILRVLYVSDVDSSILQVRHVGEQGACGQAYLGNDSYYETRAIFWIRYP